MAMATGKPEVKDSTGPEVTPSGLLRPPSSPPSLPAAAEAVAAAGLPSLTIYIASTAVDVDCVSSSSFRTSLLVEAGSGVLSF